MQSVGLNSASLKHISLYKEFVKEFVDVVQEIAASTNWIVPDGCDSVDVFLVGGGGGGAGCWNGGNGGNGGSGGFCRTFLNVQVSKGESIRVVVGRGGVGTYKNSGTPGGNGEHTTFRNLIAEGGAGGHVFGNPNSLLFNVDGVSGGSGGGFGRNGELFGGSNGSTTSKGSGGIYNTGQGTTTGAFGENKPPYYGAGGAGAASVPRGYAMGGADGGGNSGVDSTGNKGNGRFFGAGGAGGTYWEWSSLVDGGNGTQGVALLRYKMYK